MQDSTSDSKGVKHVDEENHTERLLDAAVALLQFEEESIPVKGVREALKRFLHVTWLNISLSRSTLDKLVAYVVDGVSNDVVNEDENEDDMEDVASEESEGNIESKTSNETDNNTELEGTEIMHDESADEALADMINLRKLSRKQGGLDTRRKELLMCTRCVDLLDVRGVFIIVRAYHYMFIRSRCDRVKMRASC